MWPIQAKQKLNETLQQFKVFDKSSSLQNSVNDSNSGSDNEKDEQNSYAKGLVLTHLRIRLPKSSSHARRLFSCVT